MINSPRGEGWKQRKRIESPSPGEKVLAEEKMLRAVPGSRGKFPYSRVNKIMRKGFPGKNSFLKFFCPPCHINGRPLKMELFGPPKLFLLVSQQISNSLINLKDNTFYPLVPSIIGGIPTKECMPLYTPLIPPSATEHAR